MGIKYLESVQVNQNVFIKTRKSESSNVNEIALINRTIFRLLTLFGGEQHGGFEQEPTEGTETDSILCFLCYLLLNSEAGCLASVDAESFGVFGVFSG